MDDDSFPSSVDATPTSGEGVPQDPPAAETSADADPPASERAEPELQQLLRQWIQAHPLTAVGTAVALGMLLARLSR